MGTQHGSHSVGDEAGEPRIPEKCRQNCPPPRSPAGLLLALRALALHRAQAAARSPSRNARLRQIARSGTNLSSNRLLQLDVTLLQARLALF